MKQNLFLIVLSFFTAVFYNAQDVAVNISGPKAVTTGSSVTYKIYVTNNGTTTATNVAVKAPNAANITETSITYANGPGNGGSSSTLGAGAVTLANLQGSSGIVIPSLPSGSAGVFTVTGTASSTVSNINYTATASFGGTDPNTTNNTVTFITNVYAATSCGSTTTYTLNPATTAANNSAALNGGIINLYYDRSGPAIAGLTNPLIIPVTYSDLTRNAGTGVNHQWHSIYNDIATSTGLNLGMATYDNNTASQTADPGSIFNGLPASNTEASPGLPNVPAGTTQRVDNSISNALLSGTISPLGTFTLSFGNLSLPTGVRISSESLIIQGRGTQNVSSVNNNYSASGTLAKPMIQNGVETGAATSITLDTEMELGQTYTWRYTAYDTTGLPRQQNRRGVVFKSGTITFITGTATPLITTTAPTCSANGTATISNYDSGTTYTFSPTGPTVAAGGIISGMTNGTTYTVTATTGGCQSNASNEFSIAGSTSTAGTTAPVLIVGGPLFFTNSSGFNSYKIPCGSSTANLTAIAASNTPSGTTLTWHTASPATTANKISDFTALGGTARVYAAFFDSVNDCYSPTRTVIIFAPICAKTDDFSGTPIIAGIGGTLPSIFANDSYNNITITSISGITAEWVPELWEFDQISIVNDDGTIVIPSTLAPGDYINSYKLRDKHPAGTGNINDSEVVDVIIKVICKAGSTAPTVNPSISNVCPFTTVDLALAHTGTKPVGTDLVWFTTNSTSGTPLTSAQAAAASAGIYYAYYYSSVGNCYSPASSAVTVTINNCNTNCTNPADFTSTGTATKVGITVQAKQKDWPENIPNGFIALESKEKGFVITRVATVGNGTGAAPDLTNDSVKDPKEGMLVYDMNKQCVKLFNGKIWKCLAKDCN